MWYIHKMIQPQERVKLVITRTNLGTLFPYFRTDTERHKPYDLTYW